MRACEGARERGSIISPCLISALALALSLTVAFCSALCCVHLMLYAFCTQESYTDDFTSVSVQSLATYVQLSVAHNLCSLAS